MNSPLLSSSQDDLRPKMIRRAYQDLLRIREELAYDAAQSQRTHYKSKAQHRSAKWFQTLDALRKCYRRLLQSAEPLNDGGAGDDSSRAMFDAGRAQYTRDVQVDGSLPNRAGRAERREASMRRRWRPRAGRATSQTEGTAFLGSLEAVRLALIAVWCSMWGEGREGRTSMPKYDRQPTELVPSQHSLKQYALNLFVLCVLLEELSLRSQRSFSILTAQLRTPPAPTFAPLITVLIPQVAAADRTTNRLLWGTSDGGRAEDILAYPFAELYNRVQSVASENYKATANDGGMEARAFVLDAKSRSNSAHWQRMLNAVSEAAHLEPGRRSSGSLTWLPSRLSRPTEPLPGAREAPVQAPPLLPATTTAASTEFDDGGNEDLGEVI